LNNETGPVFIEGEVNAETVGRFKDRRLFSATENKKSHISAFQLGENQEDQLKQKAINQVVQFYNRFDSLFLKLENSTGLNVWFLEHFRINFRFIERLKTQELKVAFLAGHPDGKIIQSVPKKTSIKSGKRILKEIFFIVRNSLSRSRKISGTILFHNEGGTNFSESELFGELTNHFPIFKIRSIFDLKRSLPKRSVFIDFPNSDALFLKTILSPSTWFQIKQFRLELESLIAAVENQSLNSFEREIIDHVKTKKAFFTLMFLRFLSFRRLFEVSKIESIVLSDENSPQQKVIQYAAKKTAVNIFAIQHGAIYNNHFGYTYGKYNHPPILPDVTFTWGEYYNEVLLKYGGYKTEQVKAVGSLRKSRTPKSGSTPKNKNSSVVLFATQPIPNETLRKRYLKDVFSCFLALERERNYQLIVRPHPNEKDDQYFVNVANEVGFKNYIIERNVAMEDQFNASDVLITAYSTVGAEYVEYFKPIIVLDYLKEDIAGYVKEGIAIPVYNGNGLQNVFEQKVIDINYEKYNEFINRFFYSSDGKAADRILLNLNGK
jgi:hypothetical protein